MIRKTGERPSQTTSSSAIRVPSLSLKALCAGELSGKSNLDELNLITFKDKVKQHGYNGHRIYINEILPKKITCC